MGTCYFVINEIIVELINLYPINNYCSSLEKLSDEQLNTLSGFYRSFSKETVSSRRLPQTLPVYSDACNPEEVISIGNSFPVEWEISRGNSFAKTITSLHLLMLKFCYRI